MKKILALFLSLLCLFSLVACNGVPEEIVPDITEPPATQPPVGYNPGNLCPGYDLPVITGDGDTGTTINPTTTGKVTLINFWGTWCGPCVSELPHLELLAREYADSVTVIAVHSTQDSRKAPSFLAENYPESSIVFSWETGNDYNGEYYLMLGGEGYYPYTVVLDANGIVTETKVGGMSYEEMQQLVENAGAVQADAPQRTIPETEPQVVTPAIPQAQMEDAFSFTQDTSYGHTLCYHVPKLILPDGKADRVNQMMYDQLYPLAEEAQNPMDEYSDHIMGMQFSMWQSGDIVSVVVAVTQPYNDYIEYIVYNISAVTGEILTDDQVFAHYNLSADQGWDVLNQYLDAYWEIHELDFDETTSAMIPFIEDTYSDEFMEKAAVFVGPDETMCFVARIGTPAGAGYFDTLIEAEGQRFSIRCNMPGHDTY